MKKKQWIISVVIVVLVAVVYAYSEYSRKPVIMEDAKASYSMAAEALINEFDSSPEIAMKKYVGKVIVVNGPVKDVNVYNRDMTVSFGYESTVSSVRCTMDTLGALIEIKPGAEISVKGICTGYNEDELLGKDILLNRCLVINN